MNIKTIEPPRAFRVGYDDHPITLYDCAHIELESDEQVTFKGPQGSETDMTRKSWGYYAVSSLNNRLGRFNLRPALAKSLGDQKFFLMLVETDKEEEFLAYLEKTHQILICWLDQEETLKQIEKLQDNTSS